MSKQANTNRPDDLLCFSHLRWDFVFQRPQHLMSRFAKERRVFFIEEPVSEDRAEPDLRLRRCEQTGVMVATPLIPRDWPTFKISTTTAKLVKDLLRDKKVQDYIAWYYTPMALDYSRNLTPRIAIYDCMDELSLFHHAHPALGANERELFSLCDLVFTGGVSLFEAKRHQHSRVYPFPSSVDCAHFRQARHCGDIAEDQKNLSRPRLGYAGVIDERIDLNLIRSIAEQRPEWQIVMIGPVVKIDTAILPRLANIHWLGSKDYGQLPVYMAGWDVALMPFALNDSTRFISPTKTPEYLAAGLPVISTPIRDVERQYGDMGLVRIESTVQGFLSAIEQTLTYEKKGMRSRERVDAFLATLSWDRTWQSMSDLIEERIEARQEAGRAAVEAAASQAGVANF